MLLYMLWVISTEDLNVSLGFESGHFGVYRYLTFLAQDDFLEAWVGFDIG